MHIENNFPIFKTIIDGNKVDRLNHLMKMTFIEGLSMALHERYSLYVKNHGMVFALSTIHPEVENYFAFLRENFSMEYVIIGLRLIRDIRIDYNLLKNEENRQYLDNLARLILPN